MAEVTREYRTDEIVVFWNPDRCIHTAICIRGLPNVFRPGDRPWVHIDQARADHIAEVVMRCPTGALHFERLDGGPQEQAADETLVVAAGGPLFVRGDVDVRATDGTLIRHDTRMALCRCGASENKPFCDNSHRRIGFTGR